MYIDSNIFIYAAIDKGRTGADCRDILDLIAKQKITCAASLLDIDELIWVVKKHQGKEKATKIAKAALSLPIKWIELDKSVVLRMLSVYEKTPLAPRDAAHVASMKEMGLTTILSEDRDFDKVQGIKRMTAADCLAKYS